MRRHLCLPLSPRPLLCLPFSRKRKTPFAVVSGGAEGSVVEGLLTPGVGVVAPTLHTLTFRVRLLVLVVREGGKRKIKTVCLSCGCRTPRLRRALFLLSYDLTARALFYAFCMFRLSKVLSPRAMLGAESIMTLNFRDAQTFPMGLGESLRHHLVRANDRQFNGRDFA